MKIALESDFLDYYDHYFAGSHEKPDCAFNRLSRTDMPKWEQFRILELAGLKTPLHGALFCTPNLSKYDCQVVVYTDPFAHAGEGKLSLSYNTAMAKYPNCFASVFLYNDAEENPVSYRYLAIGNHGFKLKYEGIGGGWQSNHAPEVEITWDEGLALPIPNAYMADLDKYPIWAVDFVKTTDGYCYAVDFNTAPQIKGTGIEEKIPASKIYEYIEENILRAA